METKEKTTNREQALQERMKAETKRIVGELCQLYSPEMKDQLEQAYLETVTGDPEKASKLLLDVQAVKETDDIRFLQAVAYIRGEHFDDARALLLQINENEPNSPQVLTHLAHVEFAQRRYKKAVKYFEKVHAKQMQDFNYMFEYAVSLMRSGREQKARNVFMHIIEYVEQNDVLINEFLMCDVYGFILEIDLRQKNGKFQNDTKRFSSFLDKVTLDPRAEQSMCRIIVTLSTFMDSKWVQPLFLNLINMIQKKNCLNTESAQECLHSGFTSWESYQYMYDSKLSKITAAFLSRDYTRNSQPVENERSAMIDQLSSEWNMSEYTISHPEELAYVKEKYPYTYEDNRTLIDEILRDPGSVQSRIEKLLLSLTNSTSLFDVHMAMKQDYDGFCKHFGVQQ